MESRDDYFENLRAGYAAGYTKVYIRINRKDKYDPATESFWARPITPTTVKVENIPFWTDAICCDDFVEHRNGEIIGVLERAAWTYHAAYDGEGSHDEILARWHIIWDHFKVHDIHVESACPGLFAMAVPRDVSPDQLMEIAIACPIPLIGVKQPEEHHRFD
jgi:hypothetical protein